MIVVLETLDPACTSGLAYRTLLYRTLFCFTFETVSNSDVTGLCLRVYVELYTNDSIYACNLTTAISKFKVNI